MYSPYFLSIDFSPFFLIFPPSFSLSEFVNKYYGGLKEVFAPNWGFLPDAIRNIEK